MSAAYSSATLHRLSSLCESHEHQSDPDRAQSVSVSDRVSDGCVDHGLTYSEAEPMRPPDNVKSASKTALLSVQVGGRGLWVQWNTTSGAVRVSTTSGSSSRRSSTHSSSAALRDDWTNAARLVAKEGAASVQLTVLHRAFGVYLDGQRVMRFRSPVLVKPSLRVRFAADATVYAIVPCRPNAPAPTGVAAMVATAPPHKSPPLSSRPAPPPARPVVRCEQQAASFSPLPRRPAPLIQQEASVLSSLSGTSSSSYRNSNGAPLFADTSDSWVTGQVVLPQGTEERCPARKVSSLELDKRKATEPISTEQQTQAAVGLLGNHTPQAARAVIRHFVPIEDATTASSVAAFETAEVVIPTTILLNTNTNNTDLMTLASLDQERHTSDVLESAVVVHRVHSSKEAVDRVTVTKQSATQSMQKSVTSLSPPVSSEASSTENRSDHRSVHDHQKQKRSPRPQQQQNRVKTPSQRQLSLEQPATLFAWGPVVSVNSPDWRALAARWSESDRQCSSPTSTSDTSMDAFAAALLSRRCHRGQQQKAPNSPSPQTPLRHEQRQSETVHRKKMKTQSEGDTAAPRVAGRGGRGVSTSGTSGSFYSSDNSSGGALRSSAAPRQRAISNAASTAASYEEWLRRLQRDCAESNQNSTSLLAVKAKLRLRQRVAVTPFVVETCGGTTSRYRPLAFSRGASQNGSQQNAETGTNFKATSHITSLLQNRSMTRGDEGSAKPRVYARVAGELASPHTKCVLRGVLCQAREISPAERKAGFLHDALHRTYDAATDRFSYLTVPDLPELLYSAFMTVSAAVITNLSQDRPVRRLRSPLLCAGDLFGSFKDLLVLLGNAAHFAHWSMLHVPLVLLGNYVDYGWHSVEVVMLLISWACLQPLKVHLLRGPHEDAQVNGNYAALGKRCLRYKCRQRFGARKGVALWKRMNRVFALLPLAAVVDERVFMTHGGVPQLLPCPKRSLAGAGGGVGSRVREGAGRALYSNTSGIPTPTSTLVESASKASSRRRSCSQGSEAATESAERRSELASWRPPSAVQVFPFPERSVADSSQSSDSAQHGDHLNIPTEAQQYAALQAVLLPVDIHSWVKKAVVPLKAAAAASSHSFEAEVTAEKAGVGSQLSTGVSPMDTLVEHDAASAWGVPSSPSSFSSCVSHNKRNFADHRTATDLSLWCIDPFPHPSPEGLHKNAQQETAFMAPPAAQAAPGYAPLSGPPTADFSYFAHIRAVAAGSAASADCSHHSSIHCPHAPYPRHYHANGRHTPLVHLSSADSAGHVVLSNDAPSALISSKAPPAHASAMVRAKRRVASSSSFSLSSDHAANSAAVHRKDGAARASATPTVTESAFDVPPQALSAMPTEVDFEELLLATTMDHYNFSTLQVNAAGCDDDDGNCAGSDAPTEDDAARRRRRRLVRELLWNRPRDTVAKARQPAEPIHFEKSQVRPSWWMPREVRCCRDHSSSVETGSYCCCCVFGSWGLLHFLERFDFFLVVRGGSEEAQDNCGALLSDEGRLLSLWTCTRLQRRLLQAAACVVQPGSIQLATWGTSTLADSHGQIHQSPYCNAKLPPHDRMDRDQVSG